MSREICFAFLNTNFDAFASKVSFSSYLQEKNKMPLWDGGRKSGRKMTRFI